MRIQDYVVDASRKAAQDAFRYALAVPEEKLIWSPEGGRNILGMCQELAITPTWAYDTLSDETPDLTEEGLQAQSSEMKSWNSIEKCMAQFEERFEKAAKLILAMPDEQLLKTKWLRYEGGRDFTYLEMLDYIRWNSTYHLGQIAYIQTLYGDTDMH